MYTSTVIHQYPSVHVVHVVHMYTYIQTRTDNRGTLYIYIYIYYEYIHTHVNVCTCSIICTNYTGSLGPVHVLYSNQ